MNKLKPMICALMLSASAVPAQARDLVVAAADPVGSLKDRMCQEFVDGVREELPEIGLNFVQGDALGSAKSVMEQHVSAAFPFFAVVTPPT